LAEFEKVILAVAPNLLRAILLDALPNGPRIRAVPGDGVSGIGNPNGGGKQNGQHNKRC
jgi:hypothetical protein